MTPSVEEGKNLLLKLHAEQIRSLHPKWTRSQCFAAAQAEHPELAEQFEGEATTAAAPVYRFVDAPKNVQHVEHSQPLRDKLDEILAERLERVEA